MIQFTNTDTESFSILYLSIRVFFRLHIYNIKLKSKLKCLRKKFLNYSNTVNYFIDLSTSTIKHNSICITSILSTFTAINCLHQSPVPRDSSEDFSEDKFWTNMMLVNEYLKVGNFPNLLKGNEKQPLNWGTKIGEPQIVL